MHLAQILVTPNPDPNVRNLKNDKAQNDEQARKKMDMLVARLKQGEDFVMLAQNFSEDPHVGAQWRRSGIRAGVGAGEGQSRNARRDSDCAARAR